MKKQTNTEEGIRGYHASLLNVENENRVLHQCLHLRAQQFSRTFLQQWDCLLFSSVWIQVTDNNHLLWYICMLLSCSWCWTWGSDVNIPCMFLQTQPHFVFHWFWGEKMKMQGCKWLWQLLFIVLLGAVEAESSQHGRQCAITVARPISFAPKRHSDDWNLTWHCLLDTVNFCYFLFLYNIHYWINIFYRLSFVPLSWHIQRGIFLCGFFKRQTSWLFGGFLKFLSSIFTLLLELLMFFERTHVGRM